MKDSLRGNGLLKSKDGKTYATDVRLIVKKSGC